MSKLGNVINTPQVDIETIPVSGISEICFETMELCSVCPVTGQPDIYNAVISFVPDGLGIESKSLKLFLWSYRDRGIFCEDLTVEIGEKLRLAISPKSIIVQLKQNIRGGLSLSAEYIWKK